MPYHQIYHTVEELNDVIRKLNGLRENRSKSLIGVNAAIKKYQIDNKLYLLPSENELRHKHPQFRTLLHHQAFLTEELTRVEAALIVRIRERNVLLGKPVE